MSLVDTTEEEKRHHLMKCLWRLQVGKGWHHPSIPGYYSLEEALLVSKNLRFFGG